MHIAKKVVLGKGESSTKDPKKKKPYVRGYGPVRRKIEHCTRYNASCFNCEHYYQAPGDDTEVCQNPDVLQYDMIVTESGIRCTQWMLTTRRTSVKSMFKKGKKL